VVNRRGLRASAPPTLGVRLPVLLLAIAACLGDPVGPGTLAIAVEGAGLDTVWIGAPGEPVPTGIRLRITDDAGRPLPGASLTWEAVGRNAQVLSTTEQSNSAGLGTAGWLLGTDAAEEQRLRVTVHTARRESEIIIRARAVPHVVSQLRVVIDTPAVLRLGDTLPVRVHAIDPYGNAFPAPDVAISLVDSALGSVAGASVIGGPRRGQSVVRVASHGVETAFPLRVTQYVAAIVPASDSIHFTALGAELPVVYVVRDDRGRIVADTAAGISAADTGVVQVVGSQLRSVAPGVTALRLTLGPAAATMIAGVRQRIGSLRLRRDTILLDALMDTTAITPIAHDSLGSPITDPVLEYDVSDRAVVRFAAARTLEALKPGAAIVTVRDSLTGISTSAPVVVRQRITAIDLTPAEIVFDALADSVRLGVTARDRLGSVVAGATFDYSISDTTVVALGSGNQLRSIGPGQASVSVRDPETGSVATVEVRVDQIATSLTVAVTFGNPIVTLPAGATLPLTCQAFDRNGFLIARDLALVGSVKGTVTGSGCSDARIQHSGYDTLLFASGAVQSRVPVTVSTGDSVGVVSAAEPLTTDESIRYVGEDLANPSLLALRPLVRDILAAYGNPTSNLDRARAIRDWVARTAVYPIDLVHRNGSTSNLSVLPPGKTWADVNATLSLAQWDRDSDYWMYMSSNGYAMLDRLLGTLEPATGLRADDGLMVHVAGAHYRMRDLESYRYFLCTYQTVIANTLWAAAGLHSLLLQIPVHEPAAVFIPELGKWVYQDVSFSDEYLLDGTGDPLSPLELLALATAGTASRARASKLPGPTYDPQVYAEGWTYMNVRPQGMVFMGSRLYTYDGAVNPTAWTGRFGLIDVPELENNPPFNDPTVYPRVTEAQAFPTLGVVVENLRVDDSVFVVRLASTYPNHQRFERRLQGGDWQAVADDDILPLGACRVEYRSVDALGTVSASAVLDVWAPRPEGFIESGALGSSRSQALNCM